MKEIIIEYGWEFWSADFSMLVTEKRNYGTVTLCRCKEDVNKWHKLSEHDQAEFDIWCSGRGKILEQAIINANLNASQLKPIP